MFGCDDPPDISRVLVTRENRVPNPSSLQQTQQHPRLAVEKRKDDGDASSSGKRQKAQAQSEPTDQHACASPVTDHNLNHCLPAPSTCGSPASIHDQTQAAIITIINMLQQWRSVPVAAEPLLESNAIRPRLQ